MPFPNALCRGDTVGNFARERGLLKTQGCNFYVGGEYVYRQSRILDNDYDQTVCECGLKRAR